MRSSLCVLLALLIVCFCVTAHAQQVIGISAVLSSTGATEVDTYSATDLDYVAAYYYQPYVEGYLYDNGNQIGWGSALGPLDGCGIISGEPSYRACGFMQKPLTVGDVYEIDSYHWVVTSYVVEDAYGNIYGYNPDYYIIQNFAGPGPSGSSFAPNQGGPLYYYNTEYIFLGATAVAISSAPPTISSVSPSSIVRNTHGFITVSGQGLTDLFSGGATVQFDDPDVNLGVNSQAWNQVKLEYYAGTNTGGTFNLYFSTRFGSTSTQISVGDNQPQITGMTVTSAEQGDGFDLQIEGVGFGTNPTVQISDSSIEFFVNHAGDDRIYASMYIADNSTIGDDTITVTSRGPAGQGFMGNPGQSATSNTANFRVNAGPAFQLSPALTLWDGAQGTFTINVTGGNPTGYQWSFSNPQPAGNGPTVAFSSPTSAQTGTGPGHWYAYNPATPNYCPVIQNGDDSAAQQYWNSTYDIQAQVTFDDGRSQQTKTKKTKLTVQGAFQPDAAHVDNNEASINGGPTIGRNCPPYGCLQATSNGTTGGANGYTVQIVPSPVDNTSFTVVLQAFGNFQGLVNLQLSGIPPLANGGLNSGQAGVGPAPGSTSIPGHLIPGPETQAGNYSPSVIATSGSLSATAQMLEIVPVWQVTGQGGMTRQVPTVIHYNPSLTQSSQFYNKITHHEQTHLDQWRPNRLFGDLFQPLDFYSNWLTGLSASTQSQLITQINNAYSVSPHNFRQTEGNILAGRICQAEQEAHNVSDPIDPQFIYQWCGCDNSRH